MSYATYADVFRPTVRSRALTYDLMLVLGGSLALALSSRLSVVLPFSPVPVTAQTLVVLMLGALIGSRRGAAAVLAFLAQGAAGLPVFAMGGGLAYLFGPTGGFLLGFVAAAWVVGALAERGWDRRAGTTLGAMLIGCGAYYVPGLLWLGFLVGFEQVVALGLAPFVVGDAAKIALAMASLPMGWKLLGRMSAGR